MKILFVCNQGKYRSKTAAELWRSTHDDETDYTGIYSEDNIKKKIEWADLIIVMENHQRIWISEHFPELYLKKKFLCIDIPDQYFYMEPGLVKSLKEKFESTTLNL